MRKNNKSRNKLIADNMDLINKIAQKVFGSLSTSRIIDHDDLVQDAIVGLLEWKRLTKYHPEQGKFGTFAGQRIKGAIVDRLRELDWIPRIMRVRQRAGKFNPRTIKSFDALGNVDSLSDSQAINPMRSAEQNDLREVILGMINHLPEIEKRSVYEYFYNDRTFAQIGQKIGFTEAWAHKSCSAGLNKIKHKLKNRKIA